MIVAGAMTDNDSNSGGRGFLGRVNTLATLLRAGRAIRTGNTGRATLLVGSVLLGRRRPRLGFLLQLADTVYQIRKRLR
ncbi:hypothetical protein BRC86_07250 [Halobacteriales archaeon QS_3_64_16]|nr:MAG: hypothetical protein BRC86_07250 [Halobacteriales archaeon QS_3_64_16]